MKKKEIEQLLVLATEICENPLDSPFITDTEREKAQFVTDVLLPAIHDLRTRKIIWLRSKGLCWKVIQKTVNLSRGRRGGFTMTGFWKSVKCIGIKRRNLFS